MSHPSPFACFSKRILTLTLMASSLVSCVGQSESSGPPNPLPFAEPDDALSPTAYQENFNGPSVDSNIFIPLNAVLKVSNGELKVTPTGKSGGVLVMSPLPMLPPLSSESPNSAWAYGVRFEPVSPHPKKGTITVKSRGLGGSTIDLTTYDYLTGIATTDERDVYGALASSSTPFATDQAQQAERKRTYSWWPPLCQGPRCDYGFGLDADGHVVIFARWLIGHLNSSIAAPDAAPALEGIEISSTMPFKLSSVTIESAPTLSSDISSVWYLSSNRAPANGGSKLTLHGTGFNSAGLFQLTMGGKPVSTTLIDDNTIDLAVPGGPVGPAPVVFTSGDGTLQVELADFRYYAGAAPLALAPLPIPNAALGVPYSANINVSGGTGAVQLSMISGGLPAGLKLSSDGTLSGLPSASGVFSFYVSATDGAKNEDVRVYFLQVDG